MSLIENRVFYFFFDCTSPTNDHLFCVWKPSWYLASSTCCLFWAVTYTDALRCVKTCIPFAPVGSSDMPKSLFRHCRSASCQYRPAPLSSHNCECPCPLIHLQKIQDSKQNIVISKAASEDNATLPLLFPPASQIFAVTLTHTQKYTRDQTYPECRLSFIVSIHLCWNMKANSSRDANQALLFSGLPW